MVTREEGEAALLLFMWRHMAMEERVFIRFPRKKRTLRIPVSYASSSNEIESFATEEDPPKADTFDVPCTESSSNPTGNIKRRSLGAGLPPPTGQQAKKARRMANGRFAAGASSSGTREPTPEWQSSSNPTGNIKRRSLGAGLPPPTGQQAKKARRMANGRFAAGASSSGTREPTPEWLVQLMRDKKGKDPRCIIKKGLEASDVRPRLCRLSMPISKIEDREFLTPSEENIIRRHADKLRDDGLASILVASDLKEYNVNLARWNMGKNPPYFLSSEWNHVVSDYQLKKAHKICLWSFHVGRTLYFAMVPTSQTEPGESEEDELCVSNQRQK